MSWNAWKMSHGGCKSQDSAEYIALGWVGVRPRRAGRVRAGVRSHSLLFLPVFSSKKAAAAAVVRSITADCPKRVRCFCGHPFLNSGLLLKSAVTACLFAKE